MKQRRQLLTLLSCLLVIAACGGEKREQTWLGTPQPTATSETSATATTDTATATLPGSPGGTAVVPDVAAGATVLVVLGEGSIGVPDEGIPPGPAVLTVSNQGAEVHNLFIEGEGIQRAAGDPIPAGETRNVEVQFKAGNYVFYCPVLDHREKGEQITVTIGG